MKFSLREFFNKPFSKRIRSIFNPSCITTNYYYYNNHLIKPLDSSDEEKLREDWKKIEEDYNKIFEDFEKIMRRK
jgi:hypothetical protein